MTIINSISNLFKSKETLGKENAIKNEYYKWQQAYNYSIGRDSGYDAFKKGSSYEIEAVVSLIKKENNRRASFVARYPEYTQYLINEHMPDIDYAHDHLNEYFREGGFMFSKLEIALKAACLNHALLKYVPRRFMHNAEVLLAAVVNDSMWIVNTYFDSDSFPYLTEDEWDEDTYFYPASTGKPQSTNSFVAKLAQVASFEKPIVELYENIRPAIREGDIEEFIPYSLEIEEILQDKEKAAVFWKCAKNDDVDDFDSTQAIQDLRQSLAHTLITTLPEKQGKQTKKLKI